MSEEGRIDESQKAGDGSLSAGQAGSEETFVGETADVESLSPNEELQTINLPAGQASYKLETQNMEVHHHPNVEKKNFKEYLLEFLMIFLAVTLGFLAESYREYLGDHSKEKEYIHSLIEDLKSDQMSVGQHLLQVKDGISMMDSLIAMLDTPALVANHTGELYYLARLAPRLKPLSTSNRTFEQLKNSGNFRLIRNISTSNKIMDYYEKFPIINLLSSINETEFTEYKKVAAKIFDPAVMVKMEDVTSGVKRISNNPLLRTSDYELFQELSVYAVYMHGTKTGILEADEEIKIAGAGLIEYLQKEYRLKNE